MKTELKATYGWLQSTYENKASLPVYAISEFIDNSISSYSVDVKHINKDNENLAVEGLVIKIIVETNSESQQKITIRDNAGGMDDKELCRAMQPGDVANKKATHLNQYGQGMKFGIFWLGKGVTIHTKAKKHKEEFLNLEITKENFNQLALINTITAKKPSDQKITYNSTGTEITIYDIYPNKVINGRELDKLKKAIGWRYGGLIQRGLKIEYEFINLFGKMTTETGEIEPLKIKPYRLCDTRLALANRGDFDSTAFERDLKTKLKKVYEENAEEIEKFTDGKNMYQMLMEHEPLTFSCDWYISGKPVKIKWGILAHSRTNLNSPFPYKEINGFCLLHKNRAICHGPNFESSTSQYSETAMHCFPIYKDSSGGSNTKLRIYGEIDLTGIESPEVNKSDFKWGSLTGQATGRQNIADFGNQLYSAIQDFLNTLKDAEESVKNRIVKGINKPRQSQDMEKGLGDYKALQNITIKPDGMTNDIEVDYDTIHFAIKHETWNEDVDPFIVRYLSKTKTVQIHLNTNHFLWKSFIFRDNEESKQIKTKLLYPLAIAFAICKLDSEKEGRFKILWLIRIKKEN